MIQNHSLWISIYDDHLDALVEDSHSRSIVLLMLIFDFLLLHLPLKH